MLQGRLEDRVNVGHRQGRQHLGAAVADGAAAFRFGVEPVGAALAGGAESVEEGAHVAGGEAGELFRSEAGGEVESDAGGVSGVRGLADAVDGDGVEPVREMGGPRGVGGGVGDAAVAVGDLLGEFVGGFLAGGGVDADASVGAVGGEDVSGGFPAAVLALVDGAFAVRSGPLGGGHQAMVRT
jgi:hypothetical protein